MEGGADFLKTSTGKVPVNATPEAARVMLEEIASAGRVVGFKPAGGVKTTADARLYLDLCDEIMGPTGPRRRSSASGRPPAVLDALIATLEGREARRGRGLLMLAVELIAAKRDGGAEPRRDRRFSFRASPPRR